MVEHKLYPRVIKKVLEEINKWEEHY
jgi:hypothetical protein